MKKVSIMLTGAKIHDDGNPRKEANCSFHFGQMAAPMFEEVVDD
jgi:hypothetical protein